MFAKLHSVQIRNVSWRSSSGHIEYGFDNGAENIPTKLRKFFAHMKSHFLRKNCFPPKNFWRRRIHSQQPWQKCFTEYHESFFESLKKYIISLVSILPVLQFWRHSRFFLSKSNSSLVNYRKVPFRSVVCLINVHPLSNCSFRFMHKYPIISVLCFISNHPWLSQSFGFIDFQQS